MKKSYKEQIEELKELQAATIRQGIIVPIICMLFGTVVSALLAANGTVLGIICCVLVLMGIPSQVKKLMAGIETYKLGKALIKLAETCDNLDSVFTEEEKERIKSLTREINDKND